MSDSRVRTDSTAWGSLALSADAGTVLVTGTLDHWPYVEALRKKEGGALGFIPKQRYLSILARRPGGRGHLPFLFESVILTFDNDDPTGFAYVAWGRLSRTTTAIHQIVVQQDARRWHRAALMCDWVSQEAARRGRYKVTARVAADLESNHYWSAMGFRIVGTTTSTFLEREASKTQRQLHLYEKPLVPENVLPFGQAS